MTELRAVRRQLTPPIAGDGVPAEVGATRDGALFTADWKTKLVMEGRVFHAPFAAMAATDVVSLTAGKNLDQPDFGISVPSGTSLIPLHIVMDLQTDADTDADDAFAIIMVDTDAAFAGDGTTVAVTPINHITGFTTIGTQATVFEDGSADITDPTVTKFCLDVAQVLFQAAGNAGRLRLEYTAPLPVILTGPCAIYGYAGGVDVQSWAGFASWAEVPSSRFAA